MPNFCSKINFQATKCACVPAYIHTFHTYLPTYLHAYIHAHKHTWIHGSMDTGCMHTHMHTCLLTYRQIGSQACMYMMYSRFRFFAYMMPSIIVLLHTLPFLLPGESVRFACILPFLFVLKPSKSWKAHRKAGNDY